MSRIVFHMTPDPVNAACTIKIVCGEEEAKIIYEACKAIEAGNGIEVVRRGRWKDTQLKRNIGIVNGVECSACGNKHIGRHKPLYCDACGARMENYYEDDENPEEKQEVQSDAVVHPSHYNTGKIEVWDAIDDWGLGFGLGNVVKYVARAGHKGNELEDLKKARNYLDREIRKLEEE